MSVTRPARLAGTWYEADPDRLTTQIERWTSPPQALGEPPRLLLVPHAGHMWSGPVAGAGFSVLRDQTVRRIVLLAPSHYVPFTGVALPTRP